MRLNAILRRFCRTSMPGRLSSSTAPQVTHVSTISRLDYGGCTKCCTWRCSAVAWLRQVTWAAQIPGARRIFCSRGNPPGGGQRLRLRLACCPGSIRAELHPPHPAGGDKLITGRDIVSTGARRTLIGHKPFPIRGHARPLVSAQVRCLSCAEFCRTLQLP